MGGSLLAAWQGHITGSEKAATSGSCIPDPAFSPAPENQLKVKVELAKVSPPLIKLGSNANWAPTVHFLEMESWVLGSNFPGPNLPGTKMRYPHLTHRPLKAWEGSHWRPPHQTLTAPGSSGSLLHHLLFLLPIDLLPRPGLYLLAKLVVPCWWQQDTFHLKLVYLKLLTRQSTLLTLADLSWKDLRLDCWRVFPKPPSARLDWLCTT